jgi:hypothetical protein
MKNYWNISKEIEELEQIGWFVENQSDGNVIVPVVCIEKAYPFNDGKKYHICFPNSDIHNESQELFTNYTIVITDLEDNPYDTEIVCFDSFNECVDFIYGKEIV